MKILHKVILIVFLVCAVSLSACKTTDMAAEHDVTPKEIYYDIEAVKIDLSSSYCALHEQYDPEPFIKLQEEVMAGKVNRKETVYRLKKIISSYNNVHLQIHPVMDDCENPEVIPFWFSCFGSKYYATSADKKYTKYLGWELKGIGDLSIDEVVDRIAEFSSIETPAGKKHLIEGLLDFENCYYFGLTDNGKIRLTLESEDGTTKVLKCKPVLYKNVCFEGLSPKNQTSFTNIRLSGKNYGVKGVPEISTLYAPCVSFKDMHTEDANSWFNDILNELNTGTYTTIVFDLRYNGGGNYNQMFYRNVFETNKKIFEKHNIAVITTGRTCSASLNFIDDLLSIFPHVKLFGEETGQAVSGNTAVRPQILKKIECSFNFPMNYLSGGFPNLLERNPDPARGAVPDVEVLGDFESSLNGEDAIYKAIYEYYNK